MLGKKDGKLRKTQIQMLVYQSKTEKSSHLQRKSSCYTVP
jgi:hypothetical protein